MLERLISQLKGGTIQRQAVQIMIFQGVTICLSLFLNVLIGRYLGPADKGILDLFRLLISLISTLGVFGIGSGLFYYYSNQGRSFDEVHGTGLAFVLVAGAVTILIGILGVRFWQDTFEGLTAWMVLIGFVVAPFIFYRAVWAPLTVGYGKPLLNFLMTFGVTVINLIVVFILFMTDTLTAEYLIWLTAALVVLPAVAGFAYFVGRERIFSPDYSLFKESLKYGFVIYVGGVANLLHFRVDQLMISNLLDLRAVGLYAVSIRFAEMILLLDTPLSTAALKRISSSTKEKSWKLTRKITIVQFAISGSVAIIVALLAPFIIGLYGADYREATSSLIYLLPGIVAWSGARVMSQYISYNRGKAWYLTLFSIIGLSVNVIVNLILIPQYGIDGVAIASSISYTVVVVLVLITFLLMKNTHHEDR